MRDGKPADAVFERELRLITRFRQRSLPFWPTGYPQNDWEHLFAMQHYGMPTRLLDWSENLLVAAYFALLAGSAHEHDGSTCLPVPVVWCMDPVQWNLATPGLSEYEDKIGVMTTANDELDAYRPETKKRRQKSPLAIFGTHNSNRIVSQRGTFIVWGSVASSLEAFSNEHSKSRLWRISIIGDRKKLFEDLQTLGFRETMIFPELSYLAAELTQTEGWRK
jgi:hypothetical protein